MALNCSPEFCLKLIYRYLSKAGHVPLSVVTPGVGQILAPGASFEQNW